MASFFQELRRRNVFKVAVAYAIVAWLLVQIIVSIKTPLHLPEWFDTFVIVLLAICFPIAGILAWAYEITPEGIKSSAAIKDTQGFRRSSGQQLNYVITALLMLVLGFVVVDQYLLEEPAAPLEETTLAETDLPFPDRPSVAVLPFENVSDDRSQEYFVDGLTDDLITDLAKISGLFVIARNSAFTYKGRSIRTDEVAHDLGVRYIVTGSVRRDGDSIRVNAQLVEGQTGRDIWTERYDREITDIFSVQDDLVSQIVASLAVHLTQSEEVRLVQEPAPEFRAYDLYLQAREAFYSDDPVRLRDSLDLYRASWNADPGFAKAYAGYARTASYIWRESFTRLMSNPLAKKEAEDAAKQALAINPLLADAHAVLALMSLGDGDFNDANKSAKLAVDLDPSSADAHTVLAIVLGYSGRLQPALDAMNTAMRLDPRPTLYASTVYGWALFMNRHLEASVKILEPIATTFRTVGKETGDTRAVILASAYAELGLIEDARRYVNVLLDETPYLNLAYYRLIYNRHARGEDMEFRIEALRKAGMPEWPFDFRGDPGQRLDRKSVEALISGRTWSGRDLGRGIQFNEVFQPDGTIHYLANTSSMTGTAYLRGNELCERFEVIFWGKDACGPVYRDPDGSADSLDAYIFVNAATVRYFSLID